VSRALSSTNRSGKCCQAGLCCLSSKRCSRCAGSR
jgi:hypothetical protein